MTAAIVVAAGESRRMGFDKLAADLLGKPVLAHTLSAFQDCAAVDEIIAVTSADRIAFVRELARTGAVSKLETVVEGGAERHLSVWGGIEACDPETDMLAVHDGARPLVTAAAIARCIETARESGAAALAHRITDTLKRADPETAAVTGSVDRENLWAMETPQVFSAPLLRTACERIIASGKAVTDEVSAVEQTGNPVQLVENFEPNPKITFPGDIDLAAAILKSR